MSSLGLKDRLFSIQEILLLSVKNLDYFFNVSEWRKVS